jgi:hypothetical protein
LVDHQEEETDLLMEVKDKMSSVREEDSPFIVNPRIFQQTKFSHQTWDVDHHTVANDASGAWVEDARGNQMEFVSFSLKYNQIEDSSIEQRKVSVYLGNNGMTSVASSSNSSTDIIFTGENVN